MILTISVYNMNQKIKKSLFPKLQLIPILGLQVIHDYVFHCYIDYCAGLFIINDNLSKLFSQFTLN